MSSTSALRKSWSENDIYAPGTVGIKYVTQAHLDRVSKINHFLISAFQRCLSDIKENLSSTYLFLLTDTDGVLLAMDYSLDLEQKMKHSPIHPGMVFTAKSCGVNAISETMEKNEPVLLPPEQHENPFFQSWHCYAAPLSVGLQPAGYLDVSTINADMQSELIAIAKLIPAHMQNGYQTRLASLEKEQPSIEFTKRQLTILKMISKGLTVKAIALKLKIKECTVNHHKKVIFNKLNVQSSAEAVSIASRLSYL
ncbi:LuxR C-terminal-related transcriptional regulator [Paenibacillus pabuli]|uniref:helix-turn-helix domain-containing protein n=1 Tax=Paenibacillus pabuli TaxID=1472 RepID=UPI003CE835F7